MERQITYYRKYINIFISILILSGLYLISLSDYLLFHSISELFSVIVAFSIFILVWNTRRLMNDNFFLFLGIAYLFIAIMDSFHTLSYKGMNVFSGYSPTNLPTQLWISSRYLHGFSLVIATFFVKRKVRISLIFFFYITAVICLLSSIFYFRIFPDCFIDGSGLTLFKKVSEYIISFLFLIAVFLLYQRRTLFNKDVFNLLVISFLLTIFSELCFTLYIDVYGTLNMIGHFLKILAFYFIYKAIVEIGLTRPYDIIFRNLKQNEEQLRKEKDKVQVSEIRYRRLFESAKDGILILDADTGQINEVNLFFVNMLGYSHEEFLGKKVWEISTFKNIEAVKTVFTELQSKGYVRYEDLPVETKSGKLIDVEFIGSVYYVENKKVMQYNFRDITERKKIEKERELFLSKIHYLSAISQEIADELNAVFSSLTEPVLIYDVENMVVNANASAVESLGFNPVGLNREKLAGKISLQLIGDKKANVYDIASSGILYEKIMKNELYKFKNNREEERIALVSSAPIKGKKGITGSVVVWHDITERSIIEKLLRFSEEKYRFLYEESQSFNIIIGLNGTIKDVNKAALNNLGYYKDEVLGKSIYGFIIEKQKETAAKLMDDMTAGRLVEEIELSIYAKDSSIHTILFSAGNALLYEEGSVTGIIVTGIDITERKKMEESLREAHDELETQVVQRTAELIESNRQLRQQMQERKEIEKEIQTRNTILKLLSKSSSLKEYMDSVVKFMGDFSRCKYIGVRLLNEDGKIPYESYIGFSHDFWKSENRLSVVKDQCACVRVITGKPKPQDLKVMTKEGSFYCDNIKGFMSGLSKKEQSEFRIGCMKSGFASVAVIPVRYRNKIIGAFHLADKREKMIPEKLIESIESLTSLIGEGITKFDLYDRMRHTNELLERLFASTNLLIAYMDTNFNFIRVNQLYAKADGHTPDYFIGKNHFDLFPDEENKSIFRKVVATGEPYSAYSKQFVYAKNPERGVTYWDWSIQPVKDSFGKVEGLVFCLVNVTERKKAEEELAETNKALVEAKRLSDIGTLAATIAHELRNPLGVIRIASYNIKRKNHDKLLEKHLDNIDKKILESDQIINNLLFYSRIQMPHYENIRVFDILGECTKNAKEEFKKWKVTVIKKYKNINKIVIEADSLQVKEVFNNMLSNAYESLIDKKGIIEIYSDYNKAGEEINISFKDNGIGIEPKDLERISEPFFTKKSRGVGLGLSVCYQIVNLHGGRINVESTKGKGTTFRITLPVKRRNNEKENSYD